MTVTDISKVTMPLINVGMDTHVVCPWCDGAGCDDEYCENGLVKLKKCSSCKRMKEPDQFYGMEKKQSRCIPCYKKTYFGDYRRNLRKRQA